MPEQVTEEKPTQLAGFVLSAIGVCSFGSTSPYAAVLCLEWLLDPQRNPKSRIFDRIG